MATSMDSETISKITEKEKELTGSENPVKGGPTAQAQKHANEPLTGSVISDITQGEKKVTGGERVAGGPTATTQSIVTKANQSNTTSTTSTTNTAQSAPSGVLDSATISKINQAESEITGQSQPAKGGPTAQAQKHANEPITSEALRDITEGEKKVTGGERVQGGPTATAQSELGKSRS